MTTCFFSYKFFVAAQPAGFQFTKAHCHDLSCVSMSIIACLSSGRACEWVSSPAHTRKPIAKTFGCCASAESPLKIKEISSALGFVLFCIVCVLVPAGLALARIILIQRLIRRHQHRLCSIASEQSCLDLSF